MKILGYGLHKDAMKRTSKLMIIKQRKTKNIISIQQLLEDCIRTSGDICGQLYFGMKKEKEKGLSMVSCSGTESKYFYI